MAYIYYHPEVYTTSGPKLMGRNAAGESFLRGYFLYSKSNEFSVQVQEKAHAQHFLEARTAFGRNEPMQIIHNSNLGELTKAGVIYYPGPGIAKHGWGRALHGDNLWSLCSFTYDTTSAVEMNSAGDMDAY